MKTKNILIIDDDKQILDLLQKFLEKNEVFVTTASSAEKGLALIRKSKYDLILLDIMLPDCNGIEVLKNIQKLSPNIPVIIITGGDDTAVAEICLKNGAVDFITKPFDFEYLKTTILVNVQGF